MADLWNTLLGVALLGTERSPLPTALGDDETAALAGQVGAGDPEHRLLMAAAVAAISRRAGYLPPTDTTPLEPAPDEPRKAARPRTWPRLTTMLRHGTRYDGLIVEWLERVVAQERRVPHVRLPLLFDHAARSRTNARLLYLTQQAMGERGAWLAARNPRWAFLLEAVDPPPDPGMIDEAAALELLHGENPLMDSQVIARLSVGRWTPAVTAAFTDVLCAMLDKMQYYYFSWVINLVPRIPADALGGLIARLRAREAGPRRGEEPLLELLEFRHEMLKELADE